MDGLCAKGDEIDSAGKILVDVLQPTVGQICVISNEN